MMYKKIIRHSKNIAPVGRLLLAGFCAGQLSAFTVDGFRNTLIETGYTERAVQTIQSNSGQANTLANLHSAVTDANLRLFIGGRANNDNAILLFIDSKSGGVPVDVLPYIPNDLIQSEDFGWMINNLGLSGTSGMRFESGFQPDYAIRIQGMGENEAQVHRFDLQARTAHAVGNAAPAIRGGGFLSAIRCNWLDATGDNTGVVNGVEMSLNMPLMGFPAGTGTIKVLAMLVEPDSLTASNQTLGRLTPTDVSSRPDIGTTRLFSFEAETDIQTVSIDVTHAVSDSDGDGLSDAYESNDGMFLSATSTGSNPLAPDTDGDSHSDSAEVSGAALDFVSNPSIANYPRIYTPGNFTTPQFEAGTGNDMTRLGTDLTQQYQWSRDYYINTSFLGNLIFRFTDGGGPAVNWGPGGSAGTVALNNNNINGSAPATGLYQIGFDQAALTYTFGRKVFPDSASFLAAYGLVAGVDNDGDGILNENEFAANTDPTRADSDNDGLDDQEDPQPLLAVRNIVFKVNMSIQTEIGTFNPEMDSVKVKFLDGVAAPGELALSPMIGQNGVYSGTLYGVAGGAGLSFGSYKFAIVDPDPAISDDEILNRNFALAAAHQTQELAEVFFNDDLVVGTEAYKSWAEQFQPPPGGPNLNPDNDSYTNYEEFAFGGDPHHADGSLIGMTRDGEYLIVSWNELYPSDVFYDPEQSTDLTPGSWIFPDDAFFPYTAGLGEAPSGYIRNGIRILIDATPAKYIRIKVSE